MTGHDCLRVLATFIVSLRFVDVGPFPSSAQFFINPFPTTMERDQLDSFHSDGTVFTRDTVSTNGFIMRYFNFNAER